MGRGKRQGGGKIGQGFMGVRGGGSMSAHTQGLLLVGGQSVTRVSRHGREDGAEGRNLCILSITVERLMCPQPSLAWEQRYEVDFAIEAVSL